MSNPVLQGTYHHQPSAHIRSLRSHGPYCCSGVGQLGRWFGWTCWNSEQFDRCVGNLEEDCIGCCMEIGESRGPLVCLHMVHEQRYWPNVKGAERYTFWKAVMRSISPE